MRIDDRPNITKMPRILREVQYALLLGLQSALARWAGIFCSARNVVNTPVSPASTMGASTAW